MIVFVKSSNEKWTSWLQWILMGRHDLQPQVVQEILQHVRQTSSLALNCFHAVKLGCTFERWHTLQTFNRHQKSISRIQQHVYVRLLGGFSWLVSKKVLVSVLSLHVLLMTVGSLHKYMQTK